MRGPVTGPRGHGYRLAHARGTLPAPAVLAVWLIDLETVQVVAPDFLEDTGALDRLRASLRQQYALEAVRDGLRAVVRLYPLDDAAPEAAAADAVVLHAGAPVATAEIPEGATEREAAGVAELLVAAVLHGALVTRPLLAAQAADWRSLAAVALAQLRRHTESNGTCDAGLRPTPQDFREFLELAGCAPIPGPGPLPYRHAGVDVVRALFGSDGPGFREALEASLPPPGTVERRLNDVVQGAAKAGNRPAARALAHRHLATVLRQRLSGAELVAAVAGALAAMETAPGGFTVLDHPGHPPALLCHRCGAVSSNPNDAAALRCACCGNDAELGGLQRKVHRAVRTEAMQQLGNTVWATADGRVHWDAPVNSYRTGPGGRGLERWDAGEWAALPGAADLVATTAEALRAQLPALAERLDLL